MYNRCRDGEIAGHTHVEVERLQNISALFSHTEIALSLTQVLYNAETPVFGHTDLAAVTIYVY